MKYYNALSFLVISFFLFNCGQTTEDNKAIVQEEIAESETIDWEAEREAILEMNREILHAMVVDNDASVFERYAHPDFRVIAPGGKLENKEEVIRGVNSLEATAINLTDEEVIFYGNTAILTGKMHIDGSMKPLGKLGPAKYMTVFLREKGEWQMVSRSITPCAQVAIDNGFC